MQDRGCDGLVQRISDLVTRPPCKAPNGMEGACHFNVGVQGGDNGGIGVCGDDASLYLFQGRMEDDGNTTRRTSVKAR